MDYGLNISTSGVLTSLYRMDVLSNNLANLSTVGYKPDLPITKQRATARDEDGVVLPSDTMLERLGGGAHQGRTRTQFSQGALLSTGSELDCALQGPGFFVLRESDSQNGETLRLTRNGRFSVDGQNRLVSAETGLPVMSATGDPIKVSPRAPVSINGDGTVRQNGASVGKIMVFDVPSTDQLAKVGHSMFSAPAEALDSKMPVRAIVRQGQLEQSTVDPLQASMQIANAAKQIETNLSVMGYSDRMMERAINSLGRPT